MASSPDIFGQSSDQESVDSGTPSLVN
jgi:hypothetical protein